MDTTNKSAMLTVKQTPERLEEFRIAAMLRGTTMSALVSQFIAQVVREEMQAVPAAFRRRHMSTGEGTMVELIDSPDNNNVN
jgi:hypothetical protein